MNNLVIIGNVTRDPELRTVKGDVSVCSFTVAVNRRQKGSNEQNDADFFRVTAWRGLADVCSKYLQKGKKVMVSGPVYVQTYQGNDGTTRASLEVLAQDVEFLSPAGGNHQQTEQTSPAQNFTAVQTEKLPF